MAIGSYAVPLTANKIKIGETASNFLYQCNLSARLASDAVFKSHITTAANVAVWSVTENIKKPRRVTLDLANNILIVRWDGATSTSTSPVFWICVGADVNEVDSASAFTNSGIQYFWGCDEASGTTIADYADGATGTVASPAATGAVGKFHKSVSFTNLSSATENKVTTSTKTFLGLNKSLFVLFKSALVSAGTQQPLLSNLSSGTDGYQVYLYRSTERQLALTCGGTYAGSATGAVTNNDWNTGTVTIKTGSKVNFYVNGAASGTADQPITLPATNNNFLCIGQNPSIAHSGLNGNVGMAAVYSVELTAGAILSMHNMLMDNSTFFTIGTGFSLTNISMLWNKVKWRLRAGFK